MQTQKNSNISVIKKKGCFICALICVGLDWGDQVSKKERNLTLNWYSMHIIPETRARNEEESLEARRDLVLKRDQGAQ